MFNGIYVCDTIGIAEHLRERPLDISVFDPLDKSHANRLWQNTEYLLKARFVGQTTWVYRYINVNNIEVTT